MSDNLVSNHEFISDCCRFFENLMTEAAMRRKYASLTERDWERLGSDERLIAEVELEKARRTRSGASKRERAQALVVEACGVLGEIVRDPDASPKHKIDASKALDAFADNGPERAPTSDERFSIVINLGNDEKIRIDKQIGRIEPHAGEIIDAKPQPRRAPITDRETDDMPQELLPLFAATKRTEGGGGNPL